VTQPTITAAATTDPAADDLQRMRAAIRRYQAAQTTWHAVTNEVVQHTIAIEMRRPNPNIERAQIDGETNAGNDRRRKRAEALQAFWSNEAVTYALADIATTLRRLTEFVTTPEDQAEVNQ
jgi:hypothetical protein